MIIRDVYIQLRQQSFYCYGSEDFVFYVEGNPNRVRSI